MVGSDVVKRRFARPVDPVWARAHDAPRKTVSQSHRDVAEALRAPLGASARGNARPRSTGTTDSARLQCVTSLLLLRHEALVHMFGVDAVGDKGASLKDERPLHPISVECCR